MIVELAGLPGSGKSTIARRMADEGTAVHRHVVAPYWLGLLSRPLRAVSEAATWRGVGRATGWPAWPVLWLRALGQHTIRDRPGVLHLLEEGITHHLWRACFLHPALENAPWARLLEQPHPLFVLELDSPARLARLTGKRGKGKVNRMLAESGTSGEAWRRGEELFERILEEAGRHRKVVRISTKGTVEAATVRVREAIERVR